VILRRTDDKGKAIELPDGFDNLREHNLITYKSIEDTLNRWAIYELYGHFINYCKQALDNDIEVNFDNCQLYGISTRVPKKLLSQGPFSKVQDGIYDLEVLQYNTRIIVTGDMSKESNNAIWHLFSGKPHKFKYAQHYYEAHYTSLKALMQQLLGHYKEAGVPLMSFDLDKYYADMVAKSHEMIIDEEWDVLMEKLFEKKTPDEVMSRFSTEARLKGISVDERLQGVSVDERLQGVSVEEIQAFLDKNKTNH